MGCKSSAAARVAPAARGPPASAAAARVAPGGTESLCSTARLPLLGDDVTALFVESFVFFSVLQHAGRHPEAALVVETVRSGDSRRLKGSVRVDTDDEASLHWLTRASAFKTVLLYDELGRAETRQRERDCTSRAVRAVRAGGRCKDALLLKDGCAQFLQAYPFCAAAYEGPERQPGPSVLCQAVKAASGAPLASVLIADEAAVNGTGAIETLRALGVAAVCNPLKVPFPHASSFSGVQLEAPSLLEPGFVAAAADAAAQCVGAGRSLLLLVPVIESRSTAAFALWFLVETGTPVVAAQRFVHRLLPAAEEDPRITAALHLLAAKGPLPAPSRATLKRRRAEVAAELALEAPVAGAPAAPAVEMSPPSLEARVEALVEEARRELQPNEVKKFIELNVRILDNVTKDPANKKYRTISTQSDTFRSTLGRKRDGTSILLLAGFVRDAPANELRLPPSAPLERVSRVRSAVASSGSSI